ncbi:MAG: CBS domain-containing protein [Actinobacteria bacterium]|nr:CBS domain-containing protein [Actinomycetota bacterium]
MSATRVFAARLVGSLVFNPAGDRVGKIRDVLVVYRHENPPRVVGLIVEAVGKRRVFLSIGRIASIGNGQVITTGDINPRKFEQRGGEVRVIAEMLGRRVHFDDKSGDAIIEDASLESTGPGEWEITSVFVRRPRTASAPFAKGVTALVAWDAVTERQPDGESQSAEQLIATYSELKPADLANTLLDLPSERMMEVAEELPDDRLADVLEEMDESDQIDIIEQLDDERVADVLEQMEPDDAADLIAELPAERGKHLLELMEPEDAEDVRLLLSFGADTAGGLMTSDPIILSAESTVAEALAMIRRHDTAPALAAAVCVTLPPYESPTGRFLGLVHFQRMLRYPPHERLGTLIDSGLEPIQATTSAAEVARILASYNLVSVPVVDEAHRLVGVVTIDDVLDYLLPDDWRSHDDDHPADRVSTSTSSISTARPRKKVTRGTR